MSVSKDFRLLPEHPIEKIAPLSAESTRLYRNHDGRRVPRPGISEVVKELHQRGYHIGITANMITETEIPNWIASEGLTKYFRKANRRV